MDVPAQLARLDPSARSKQFPEAAGRSFDNMSIPVSSRIIWLAQPAHISIASLDCCGSVAVVGAMASAYAAE